MSIDEDGDSAEEKKEEKRREEKRREEKRREEKRREEKRREDYVIQHGFLASQCDEVGFLFTSGKEL
ncbi:hypothetical protein TURU_162065 [Turdus rufiventris]|nr:hypothetical protein TURU_162065 [Turdus rufiventris]